MKTQLTVLKEEKGRLLVEVRSPADAFHGLEIEEEQRLFDFFQLTVSGENDLYIAGAKLEHWQDGSDFVTNLWVNAKTNQKVSVSIIYKDPDSSETQTHTVDVYNNIL